ncbi:MAG: molybdenum cofactor biosynthesis protein MoaE, partial [Oscillospiraceae bacterium]|nr:molybdenum cofactor biosynthesis protein MoaE [Oscillospiraceae bacterium]
MTCPSLDAWLREAKALPDAPENGMYLFHNGVVRAAPKAVVRLGEERVQDVGGMLFSYDGEKVAAAIERAKQMRGIFHVRVWLNSGRLALGDDIMLVLIGGDIRPHVIDALQSLVGEIKNH